MMQIVLFRKSNPFFDSGASANRFAGLVQGLLLQGCSVTLVVTGGYCSRKEKKCKGLLQGQQGLIVVYTQFYLTDTLLKRRIHQYFLGWWHGMMNKVLLQKYFKKTFDFYWITNELDITKCFYSLKYPLKGKSLIELNEYNDIYKYQKLNPAQFEAAKERDQNLIKALSRVDCVAVMTNVLMKHYSQYTKPEAQFLLLPMTVDMTRFEAISEKNVSWSQPYIAYTGSMSNQKDGVDILIKAFIALSKNFPNYKLYLAGYYHTDVEDQKKMVREAKLENRIFFLGAMDSKKIPSFLQSADVLVLPRPDSHQAQGGFPTKLGEYLATSNPVCVTSVGEIPDYLDDNVSVFMAKPGDVDSFVNALHRALSEPERARKIGENGRQVALLNFATDIQAKRLAKFLQQNINPTE